MIAYACQNLSTEERLNSSSGAIFPLIAKWIIDNGGVVYGAAFDSEFNVTHIRVDNYQDLQKLYKSKYVFSNCNVFTNIQFDLLQGKNVLFTGTPCQVNGLNAFLKRQYDNLYLIDFVCHGTPPQEIWKKYLNSISKEKKISAVEFRDKSLGWEKYRFTIRYADGSIYSSFHSNDLYMFGFSSNLILRQSCFNCKNKGNNRKSDITLGDLWGVKDLAPDLSDDTGTSILVINSSKGQFILNAIQKEIRIQNVNARKAFDINLAYSKSVSPNKYYDNFFSELDKGGNVKGLLKKYRWLTRINRIFIRIFKLIKL